MTSLSDRPDTALVAGLPHPVHVGVGDDRVAAAVESAAVDFAGQGAPA